MELRQLEYLVAVADEGSFTRAAARAHVAQPGVSAQIRRLEAELGQELLDRSGGTVTPTAVGAAVLPHARAALEAVAEARHAVVELTGLLRGRVKVGVVTGCGAVDLPAQLAEFRRAHPGVDLGLTEDGSDRLVEALRSGALDLAVIGLGGTEPGGLDLDVFANEPLVGGVADGHPLAGRDTVPIAELRDVELISMPRGTGLRACLDEGCATAGFAPRVTFEAGDLDVLMRLAAQGLGMAILPGSRAAASRGLHAVELTGPRLRGRLALAVRAGGPASPAARALAAHVREGLLAPD